jgi:hypothetical protein
MRAMLHGFADELIKLAGASEAAPTKADPVVESLRQKVKENQPRDYLRAALAGAIVGPLSGIAGRGVKRVLHNRAVEKALVTAGPEQARRLRFELQTGPFFGKMDKLPTVSPDMLATDAITGALGLTAFQGLRHMISGQ